MTRANPPVPDGYPELLAELKRTVAESRWRAQRVVNTELISMYWRIGRSILVRQDVEGLGRAVVDRLSEDLRQAFPGTTGLGRRNLFYMRSFATAWSEDAIVQQPVGRLPWGHVTVLLDKVDDPTERDWYAAAAVEHGWTRDVLLNQIMNRLHARAGAAPSNFPAQLPAADSELAQQLTRDPYVLDFLDLTGPVAERDLEQALMNRLQDFLLELGHGFAGPRGKPGVRGLHLTGVMLVRASPGPRCWVALQARRGAAGQWRCGHRLSRPLGDDEVLVADGAVADGEL